MSDGDIIGVHTGPALARLPCASCGVDTLHRGVHCVHCDRSCTRFAAKAEKKPDWTISRKANAQRR